MRQSGAIESAACRPVPSSRCRRAAHRRTRPGTRRVRRSRRTRRRPRSRRTHERSWRPDTYDGAGPAALGLRPRRTSERTGASGYAPRPSSAHGANARECRIYGSPHTSRREPENPRSTRRSSTAPAVPRRARHAGRSAGRRSGEYRRTCSTPSQMRAAGWARSPQGSTMCARPAWGSPSCRR